MKEQSIVLGIPKIDEELRDSLKGYSTILVIGEQGARIFIYQAIKNLYQQKRSSRSRKAEVFLINYTDNPEDLKTISRNIGWNIELKKSLEDTFDGSTIRLIDYYGEEKLETKISPEIVSGEIVKRLSKLRGAKPAIIVFNSVSMFSLFSEEERNVFKLLNSLSLAIRKEKRDIIIFFLVDEGLHEERFINKIKSLVNGSIVFRENVEPGFSGRFFRVEGFGRESTGSKWHQYIELKGYGIVPIESLKPGKEEIESNRMIEAEEELVEELFLSKKKEKKSKKKPEETEIAFRTGFSLIDGCFADENNPLGGMGQYYSIGILTPLPLVDMYPWYTRVLMRNLTADGKYVIELSVDDTPYLLLDNLETRKMEFEKEILQKMLQEGGFRFITALGGEPREDLKELLGKHVEFLESPHNVTLLLGKYRSMHDRTLEKIGREEGKVQAGPIIILNSFSTLAGRVGFENAFSVLMDILVKHIWAETDEWARLLLVPIQRGFLSKEEETNVKQTLDGLIEFEDKEILGNRITYFRASKLPGTNRTTPWIPYIVLDKVGVVPLDGRVVKKYLDKGLLSYSR